MRANPLTVIPIATGLAGLHEQLAHYRKFKYLNYVPSPIQLPPSAYDLVADEAFCQVDNRLPLLIWTQYGIFPSINSYPGRCSRNYPALEGIACQYIGLVGRGYLSNNEHRAIFIYQTDDLRNRR